MTHSSEISVEILFDVHSKQALSMNLLDNISHRLTDAAIQAAQARGFAVGQIGIRICSDDAIREVNRRHLTHDYATDVISFGYVADPPRVEGELVVSIETAQRTAAGQSDWSSENELLLYVVHGVLHLCGMDDVDPSSRSEMRVVEQQVLTDCGVSSIVRFGADTIETCAEIW